MANPHESSARKPLRLWPGVAAAIALVVLRFLVPAAIPDAILIGMIGGLICAAVILLWWLFFSRAPWLDRIGALVLMVASVFVGLRIVDVSIRGGMMGLMLPVYSIFVLPPALVLWAVVTRGRSDTARRAWMVVMIFGATATFALLRTNGVLGGAADLAWRWTPTAEERLLAKGEEKLVAPPPAPPIAEAGTKAPVSSPDGSKDPASTAKDPASAAATAGSKDPASMSSMSKDASSMASMSVSWPGFRGPSRDSAVRGLRINSDWTSSPPVEVWRRAIGPGWSSFAVQGDVFYTQEQRGEHEMVTCYQVSTGKPVWMHKDAARFYESNAGAGPRGTPTLSQGRVYTFGATGIVNVLDAGTGARLWSRNAATDTGASIPGWGFSSSPLVVDDVVIIAVAGRLIGYDRATGTPRWTGEANGGGYSSPHLYTIDGVPQVLLLSGTGATSVSPADGKVLWKHAWEGGSIVQPAMVDGDLVINSISMMGGEGLRRLTVKRAGEGWAVEERWTSKGLKPYFNDFVVHKGHAYGFDGSILASVDLADGKRKWKGGRYGEGQLILLADQDLLLVVSEEGELALVNATPDKFTEVARFAAIEGKTWNHPAIVGNLLLVRNGEEMAAFRLR
jgi:outer membrane protein assembly factor BamB